MAFEGIPLYTYIPTVIGAGIFTACFFYTTVLHIFQAIKRGTPYMIPLIVGGFFEWIGYIGRIFAHDHLDSLPLYVFHTITLLVAPALFAASIYMILGRIILLTNGDGLALVRARRMTAIFVAGDIASFMVQSTGGGMMATPQNFQVGAKVILAGLLIQNISFGFFVATGGVFHFRMKKHPTPESLQVRWEQHMYPLYIASGLILIRSIFRTIEFGGGYDGPITQNEALLYCFDSVLMFGVMIVFNLVHPGDIVGKHAPSSSVRIGEGAEASVESVELRESPRTHQAGWSEISLVSNGDMEKVTRAMSW